MSTCRPADMIPADLIHANTYLYPYRSLYIQYYIYDKPCMRGRSACWQLDMYKHIHVYLPTCHLGVLVPANLSVYQYRSMHMYNTIYELRNLDFGYAKPVPQISCVLTAQMNSDVVFDTHMVQSFFFLNPKFQA